MNRKFARRSRSVRWPHKTRSERADPRSNQSSPSTEMSSLRVLDLVKPFGAFLPEIISPERKPTFQTRIIWTGRQTFTPKQQSLTFSSYSAHFSRDESSSSLRNCLF